MNRSLLLVALLAAVTIVACNEPPHMEARASSLTRWETVTNAEDRTMTMHLRHNGTFTYLAARDGGRMSITVTERCQGRESITRIWTKQGHTYIRDTGNVADTKVDCAGKPDTDTFEQHAHALTPPPFSN